MQYVLEVIVWIRLVLRRLYYCLIFCFFRYVLPVLVVDGRSIWCWLCYLFDWNWGSFDILYVEPT